MVNELMKGKLIREGAMTITGKTMGENCRGREVEDNDVIYPLASRCAKMPDLSCSKAISSTMR